MPGRDNVAGKRTVHSTAMIQDQWQQYLDSMPAPGDAGPPGLAWVPQLAAVRFQGSNARDFLQGYLTCDLGRLDSDALTPMALCNLKGRVVVNGWCAAENDDDVLVVVHTSLVDTLARFLEPYLKFSRNTRLVDRRSEALLLAALDLPDTGIGLQLDDRRRLLAAPGLAEARALWERHPHVSAETWLAALTADGIVVISAPVSETFLPQMLGLDELGAIDFQKGCYLGQEVVARAQHRGQVKRRLTRLVWQGDDPPEPGGMVTDEAGTPHGTVVQSAVDGAGTGPALAVLGQAAPQALRQGDVHLRRVP